jgi:hypothetical protein
MHTPPPTGNAWIDGVMPLLRLLDAAAAAEPVLMWLAWAMTATALAALPALASRVHSLLLSLLLTVPGSALLGLSVWISALLLGDTRRLHPLPTLALALAVSAAPLLIGWRYAGALPRHLQSAEVTLRIARPVLVMAVLLVAVTLHPLTTPAAIPPLLGGSVLVTEVILTRLTLAALRRSSTSRSSADLTRFGCLAPVYIVPDRSMAFVAAAVGLTHASSAVFLQQHVEDALQSDDVDVVGRATHILAHEAGHVVQHHGLWRTLAASVVAAILPIVVRGNDVRSTVILVSGLLVSGLAVYAFGEWAAERFAERAMRTPAPDRTAWETSR